MKITNNSNFWICTLAVSLICLHLNLVWYSDSSDLFSCSLLFWGTTAYVFLEQNKIIKFNSNFWSSTSGLLIINLILFKSFNIFGDDIFLRIYPVLTVLSLGLLISGFSGLKRYWQPLVLLGFLAVPWEFIYLFIDLSLLTTKFSTFILWLLGFEVERQRLMIILPTGSVEVYDGCSGLRMILQLLGIALIFLVVLKPQLKFKFLIPAIAIGLGFTINGIRVAVMAIFVALQKPIAFKYWHVGNGSLIFSILGVGILSIICIFLLKDTLTVSRN